METTRNTNTRTITLRITEEELKRAIAEELGPLTVRLESWDLTAVELDYPIDAELGALEANPSRPAVLDFTFELESEHPTTASELEEAGGAPDPAVRSTA